MKKKIYFGGLFAFAILIYFSPVLHADEISELNKQLKLMKEQMQVQMRQMDAMQKRIEMLEVEKRQERTATLEAKKVEEPDSDEEPSFKFFEDLHIGGHLKFYMFDQSQGSRNGDAQSNNISAGVNTLYLYFSKTLSDWLSFEIEPEISISAAATPALGSDITRATTGSVSTALHKAYMTIRVPHEVELKVGLFNPIFSEDYAKEIWWDQLYHTNKGIDYVQSWNDSGIEVYKNFDFEKWSLPTYLYYLNGNTAYNGKYVDNNDGKTVLFHIAPEFFQTKLRLLGSFAYGLWDDGDDRNLLRYALGVDWKYKKLNIYSEYLYSKWDQLALTGQNKEDGTREGYQVRMLYRFNPKWRGLINYSHAELYKTGGSYMRTDFYDTTTLGINYFITESSSIIGQFSFVDGDRSDGSESLTYERLTLGWRTTF